MATLTARLDRARGGTGSVVLLAGEPGVGKTRTAEEFASLARARGCLVAWGRCYEGEGAPSFWPWVQIMRALILDRSSSGMRAEMGAGAPDIAEVVPQVRERLPGLSPSPVVEPAQARFRFFDSMTSFLRNVALKQPLVLVLDDLHCADTPSLLLLQFLVSGLGEAPLVIVGTYRDTEVQPIDPLGRTVAELARTGGFQLIALRGLGREAVARFIRSAAGVEVPESVTAAVYGQTDGNPFFVTEVIRLLGAERRLEESDELLATGWAVPQTVREAIRRRVGALPDHTRQLLLVAAVLGRSFHLAALAQTDGLSWGEAASELAPAVGAGLVDEQAARVGQYRFRHALIRETLYEELSAVERMELHARAGEVLEALYRTDLSSHLEELAHHFFLASGAGDLEKAASYAVRAARQSTDRLAYEEAARHFQVALEVQQLGVAADPHERCELWLSLGEAWWRAGARAKARESFARAGEVAGREGTSEQVARAALGYGGLVVPAGLTDRSLVSRLEDALILLGEVESGLRARVLARLAMELYWSPERGRADALVREAVALARRVDDRPALCFALNARRFVIWGPDALNERLQVASELLGLAEQSADVELALQGHRWLITDRLELGDVAGARAELEACTLVAEEARQPLYLWYVSIYRALWALLEGRFEEGEQLASHARTTGQRAQNESAEVFYLAQVFICRREQGRLGELEDVIAGLADRLPAMPLLRCLLALIHAETNKEPKARMILERSAARGFRDFPQDLLWLASMAALSEVCATLQDATTAAALYRLLLPYGERNILQGTPACSGSAHRYLGLLASTMRRWEDAERHFAAAVRAHASWGAAPFLARGQYEHAWMLVARDHPDDRERARELLESARQEAERLGMSQLANQVQALTAQLGGQEGRPPQLEESASRAGEDQAFPSPELTPREVEVLRLLAGGASNQEIAATLVISVHTVERHLANIYAKIGARRRADATRYALRHGLA
jgi:ATP/maltotriose-dependent transcriptional regulator MalT